MSNLNENTPAPAAPSDFIRDIVAAHVTEGKYPKIHTRFPPEPNGYLHIGHAKSICLNFGIAHEFGGVCNLRMDDTNPTKEDIEYVESIQQDVNWLIGGWAEKELGLKEKGSTLVCVKSAPYPSFEKHIESGETAEDLLKNATPDYFSITAPDEPGIKVQPFYASDYFTVLYEYVERLIKMQPDQLRPSSCSPPSCRLLPAQRMLNRKPVILGADLHPRNPLQITPQIADWRCCHGRRGNDTFTHLNCLSYPTPSISDKQPTMRVPHVRRVFCA